MTTQIDDSNTVEEPTSAVQGSPEPQINKHAFNRRAPLIYKILGVLVVIVVLGYVGLRLYWMYKEVAGDDQPVTTAPESGVTTAKRRVDLGQNTQFFEKEPVAPTPGDTGTPAPGNPSNPPVAELSFKKYLSIPAQNGSGSNRSSTGSPSNGASEPVSEPAPPSSAPQAVTDTKEVTGMKVESIAMDPNLYIEENTYIPCTLQNRFVSDVAGRISCVISEDVYSANSHVKLIEKGTKAFGVYRTGALKQGQGRMFVVWTQLRTRDFKKVTLVDTQATGQLGESGIDGWIDDHFWERFKGALLLSTVQDVATAFAKRSGNQSQDSDYTQSTREGMAEMSNTALENSINIPPTMYKNQGDIIGILVGEDIDFSGVYAVRLKKMNMPVHANGASVVTNLSLDFYKKGMFGDYLGTNGLTEMAVNRPGGVFLKIDGIWSFEVNPKITLEACERFGKTLATYNGDHIDETKPLLSATLESGERVQAVRYPACERGTYSITVRVPTDKQIPHQKYIDGGFYSEVALEKKQNVDEQRLLNLYKNKRIPEFMELAVKMGKTIVFAGATGSGKTTYMKTLLAFVPENIRIITIQDTPEIKFYVHKNYVHLFYPSEASNTPGAIVTAAVLLRSCFRMNPDRIFLAEVRGGETWDFYKVVGSGHGGSMTSLHSGSVEEAIDGLIERCYQNAECQMLPYAVLKRKILNSTDIICHVDVSGDVRRMGEIYFKPVDQQRYMNL